MVCPALPFPLLETPSLFPTFNNPGFTDPAALLSSLTSVFSCSCPFFPEVLSFCTRPVLRVSPFRPSAVGHWSSFLVDPPPSTDLLVRESCKIHLSSFFCPGIPEGAHFLDYSFMGFFLPLSRPEKKRFPSDFLHSLIFPGKKIVISGGQGFFFGGHLNFFNRTPPLGWLTILLGMFFF